MTSLWLVVGEQNLSSALEQSAATWKIVVGHHTIRSLGHHGDTLELVQQVLPILEVRFALPAPVVEISDRAFSFKL